MYLYRYRDRFYSYEGVKIELEKYKVIKETPQGYWISKVLEYYTMETFVTDDKKWIGKNSIKKFAFETRKDAMRNFRFRKAAQVRILEERLYIAKVAYEKAKKRDLTYDPVNSIGTFNFNKKGNDFGFLTEEDVMI